VGRLKLEEFSEEFLEAISVYCDIDRKASNNYSELDSQLFEDLKKLRNTLARERGLPAYCIFNNETLKEMATLKPIKKTQLIRISGVGQVKLNDFGDSFIRCIMENV
jgi:ATP-dependent DNA helicase RecQ